MPLLERLYAGSFDASRPSHRRALLEDDGLLELEVAEGDPDRVTFERLRDLQLTFRARVEEGSADWAGHLARLFERDAAMLTRVASVGGEESESGLVYG